MRKIVIGQIIRDGKVMGTGFLVEPDIVMTVKHNVVTADELITDEFEEKEIMFPGYIFIDSDNPQQIYEHLNSVPELTKMLGRDKNEFTPIEAGKEAMFKAMVNDNYEIPLSVGVIEGDKVIVKEGPLSGMEGLIKKIDRHKRVAVLNAQMFEQDVDIKIGLEIIEKYKK